MVHWFYCLIGIFFKLDLAQEFKKAIFLIYFLMKSWVFNDLKKNVFMIDIGLTIITKTFEIDLNLVYN